MKYYRIPKELDGKRVFAHRKQKHIELMEGELFTFRELERAGLLGLALRLKHHAFEVSRKKIYWSFGVRFALEGAGKEATA